MKQISNQSEVAKLLDQIEVEYLAAQRGLMGFAESASHSAINARIENLGKLHEDLQKIVGDQSTQLFVECLNALSVDGSE